MKLGSKIFILSSSGFPFKISAANQKFRMLAKSFNEAGYETVLLSKLSCIKKLESDIGIFEGIKYVFLSGTSNRIGLLNKTLGVIKAYFTELNILIKARSSQKNYIILSYCSFHLVIYYWFLCKLFKYKFVVSIMEYHPALVKRPWSKINAILFDNYSFCFSDGALPISHFLNEVIKKRHKKLPTFLLPVLADFNELKNINSLPLSDKNYFLYCGSIGYMDTIKFIIDSFLLLARVDIKLKLVLSGKKGTLLSLVNELKIHNNIEVHHDLSYPVLYEMYSNSLALLIPLRPLLQDKARFSQKIAEYLASGRPIVTNKYGEIGYYFTDSVNAFVVESYDKREYSKKMEFIIDNQKIATDVGKNGRELGLEEFHYQNFSVPLANFLEAL